MSCIDYNFVHFDDDIFRRILDDIYNEPTQLFYISTRDLNELVELTYHTLKLKSNIVIINYYNELRIVGFDSYENQFKLYTLPINLKTILDKLGFIVEETNYMNILDSFFDIIDFSKRITFPDQTYFDFDPSDFKLIIITNL